MGSLLEVEAYMYMYMLRSRNECDLLSQALLHIDCPTLFI